MDPLTHALASYTLKRAAFPRVSGRVTIAMLIAGTIADVDLLSAYISPSAFLTFYRTYSHSLLAALLFSMLVTLPFLMRKSVSTEKHEEKVIKMRFGLDDGSERTLEEVRHSFAVTRERIRQIEAKALRKLRHPSRSRKLRAFLETIPFEVFGAALAASVLHLLLDLCQSAGVELFWPVSKRRFALDWVAHVDLWMLAILLAGILLPMLSGLVTEEIGGKSKGPRGRLGASVALAAMILYIGLRFILHGNALAALESRSYSGESMRKTAAFAEPISPFRWHGIVETESALHDVEVEAGPGASFDPDSATTSYKPESSPALDAARDTAVARRFLQVARFPKATVEKTPQGFHIILRAFPYGRESMSGPRVHAVIETDSSRKVLSEELAWDSLSK